MIEIHLVTYLIIMACAVVGAYRLGQIAYDWWHDRAMSGWKESDDLERKLQEATEANTSCTIYIASQMERIDELEAQLAAATEANTSCTRYIADQEIRIANLEHLLGDEDDEDKPYYDTPGGF